MIKLLETIEGVRREAAGARAAGRTVGLVPTMGALHEGHARLIETARAECGVVVVSIFVNPTQFNQQSDYDAYPRVLDEDARICGRLGADFVFAPDVTEMYPEEGVVFADVRVVADHLCGRYRPGHFRGVATVVLKLLNIVQPDRAYFGEKDAQQLAVIRRLVRDLNLPIAIVAVPTVREADGLALSSRNRRLDASQRRAAAGLYRLLSAAANLARSGEDDVAALERRAMAEAPLDPLVRIEYFEVVDPVLMQPVQKVTGPVRIAVAAWVGETRLIDNVAAAPAESSE